jgi:hypothetical protein
VPSEGGPSAAVSLADALGGLSIGANTAVGPLRGVPVAQVLCSMWHAAAQEARPMARSVTLLPCPLLPGWCGNVILYIVRRASMCAMTTTAMPRRVVH